MVSFGGRREHRAGSNHQFFIYQICGIVVYERGDIMPELPEVETVKETLKRQILHRQIMDVKIYYPKLIEYPTSTEFKQQIIGERIQDMKRRGKWLLFELDHYYLLSHLRMEGKYFIRKPSDEVGKHEHIAFVLDNGEELRYQDTRKFGRMHLILKEKVEQQKPLSELGLEPWDDRLTSSYLWSIYQKKRLPIKTVLLDQRIVVGIGNIYANEILFLSKLNPYTKTCDLRKQDCKCLIQNIRQTLERAIQLGGTTIRSYTSSEGVHGLFQNELYVHGKVGEACPTCKTAILKETIGGRGTYYCPHCQK